MLWSNTFFSLLPHPSLFPPWCHPSQMMFALQLLLQGKSNQQAAGLAFHFEKCQVRTCLSPRIICAAVGSRSQRLVFLRWLWWDLGARKKIWRGSEKHRRAMGKGVHGWQTTVPSSLPAWSGHFPEGLWWQRGGCPAPRSAPGWIPPHCHARQGYRTQAGGKSVLDVLLAKSPWKLLWATPVIMVAHFITFRPLLFDLATWQSHISQYRHTLHPLFLLSRISGQGRHPCCP